MCKSIFLKHFQENLKIHLKTMLQEELNIETLCVSSEDKYLSGTFRGIMDLCIFDENNLDKIIAIEIEHISNHKQAARNIEKLKEWTHRSSKRDCGLIQLFNEDCGIHPNKIDAIIYDSRQKERMGNGFYYDFFFYKINDKRRTNQAAKDIVYSMDFMTRLWMLMKDVKMVET